MLKLAIFVEGYTELLFIEKLVNEIAGENNIVVSAQQTRGGGRGGVPKYITRIKAEKLPSNERFYVLIVDCGGDRQVVPKINEEHDYLTRDGYHKIIGLRDLRPDLNVKDIPKLMSPMGFRYGQKGSNIPVHYILAIQEIEAWFLAEHTHFQKIHPNITLDRIISTFGFDPSSGNMEDRVTPQQDLHAIYQLEGLSYSKGSAVTVNALDFAEIYFNTAKRFLFLNSLIECLDTFFSLTPPVTE